MFFIINYQRFGIETLETRLEILNFNPDACIDDSDIASLEIVKSKSFYREPVVLKSIPRIKSPIIRRSATVDGFRTEIPPFHDPSLDDFNTLVINPKQPIEFIDTTVEPSSHGLVPLYTDGQFPNSVYMNDLLDINLLKISDSSKKMQGERKVLDEIKALELSLLENESTKAYKEKMKILSDTMKKTTSEEELEESALIQEEKEVSKKKEVEVVVETVVEVVVKVPSVHKKKVAGNYTKKVVPVNERVEVIVEVVAVEEEVVVDRPKIPLTIPEILSDALHSLSGQIDTASKLLRIQEMNTAYGKSESSDATPEYIQWTVDAYESCISGTTMDAWKVKLSLLKIMEGIESPWFIPHLFLSCVDELSEIR